MSSSKSSTTSGSSASESDWRWWQTGPLVPRGASRSIFKSAGKKVFELAIIGPATRTAQATRKVGRKLIPRRLRTPPSTGPTYPLYELALGLPTVDRHHADYTHFLLPLIPQPSVDTIEAPPAVPELAISDSWPSDVETPLSTPMSVSLPLVGSDLHPSSILLEKGSVLQQLLQENVVEPKAVRSGTGASPATRPYVGNTNADLFGEDDEEVEVLFGPHMGQCGLRDLLRYTPSGERQPNFRRRPVSKSAGYRGKATRVELDLRLRTPATLNRYIHTEEGRVTLPDTGLSPSVPGIEVLRRQLYMAQYVPSCVRLEEAANEPIEAPGYAAWL